MAQQHFLAGRQIEMVLLALQAFQVLFLWVHDWQIRAWWIPYLFRAEPERAARYQIMFGKTHSLLPPRNGMVPDTAHILLHSATAVTLIILLMP